LNSPTRTIPMIRNCGVGSSLLSRMVWNKQLHEEG
jgi:hypothetical protein